MNGLKETMNKKVTVLGAGAWGTAFSNLLAENNYKVFLWAHEIDVVNSINEKHENERFLHGIKLNKKIEATCDIKYALENSKWIFEVIPVQFLRDVLGQAKPYFNQDQTWVILSKGIEQKTLLLPSQILDEVFGFVTNKATINGPNFARDFAEKAYTATTVAAENCAIAKELQQIIANSFFRPYVSTDIMGVQVGGAIKNLLALAIGIIRGAGYKDNTIAFILTRGLSEMALLAEFFGGKKETIFGLSGLGDLVLTAFGQASRNQNVGIMLGQGFSLEHILKNTNFIPEGVNTAVSIKQLIEKNNLNLPICSGVFDILYNNKSAKTFLDELMECPLTTECI